MATRGQSVEALLEELGELLDPAGILRQVERTYTLAVVLMAVKGQAPDELAELAALLHRATDISNELSKVRA